MIAANGMHIRTHSYRAALNDLRAIRSREGALPPSVTLDDGTTLHVEPFVARPETQGYRVGDVVPGVFVVTRRDVTSRKIGEAMVGP